MSTSSTPAARRSGRLLVVLGLALPVLGLLGYTAQILAGRLWAPWYVPLSGTLGAVLLIVALWLSRSIWRVLALLLVLLVGAAQWTFLIGTRLPAYTGPIAEGQTFPTFSTLRADGTPLTERDLHGDKNNVLVFFRGRW